MKRLCKLLAVMLAAIALCTCAVAEEADPAAAYEAAMALYEAKEYEQAISAFEALGDYENSQKMLANSKWYWKEQRYDNALDLYKAEDYEAALALFEELGSFDESKKYAGRCRTGILKKTYQQAETLYAEGQLEAALEIYQQLDDYGKSESRIEEINALIAQQQQADYEQACYDKAAMLKAEGKLAEARDLFVEAGNTADSTDQIYEILDVLAKDEVYSRAVMDMGYGRYADAAVRFETLGDYLDSVEKAAEAREKEKAALYEEAAAAEDVNRAYILYLYLADYGDSAQKAEAIKAETGILTLFRAAEQLEKEDRYAEAAVGYAQCEGYNKSDDLAEQMQKDAESAAQFERAHILTDLWKLEEANAIYKALDDFSYASRMGIERISAAQLRDDATSDLSATFTAPDGTTHRYRMFKGVHRWVEAEAFCRALGGHLATMTTPEENDFVHSFMRGNGFTTAYFGLEDEERDHTWEWVTGEPVEYLNWDSGEPSYSPRERYGMYFYKHIQGTWNDAHFYEHDEVDPGCSFICEWDL